MKYSLKISGIHYDILRAHLYPGDNFEAVSLALCGRFESALETIFLVNEIIPIKYENCLTRSSESVTWSTEGIIEVLKRASQKQLSILKIHSHPNEYGHFSVTDDISDKELFQSIYGWIDGEYNHVSAVMLPTGEIFGRVIQSDLSFSNLDSLSILGDDIIISNNAKNKITEEYSLRTIQAFGEGTVNKLKSLTIVIAGCSGTGSPVVEQLVRLGVGKIVLIDPDNVEEKNLNRITNSTMEDAILGLKKVTVLKKAIDRIGLGTDVIALPYNLYESVDVLKIIAKADVIFGCVDSIDGRHLLNQIATFYLIPYFDLGVKLISDGKGGIDQIMGTVHYIQPGGDSLLSRGVYNSEDLRSASIYRKDFKHYQEQNKLGYIVDIRVDSPAVVSINTQIAAIAVNEFLARIHLFRYDDNKKFAVTRISFTDSYILHEKDNYSDNYLKKYIGRGDMIPFLNMPEF